MKFCFFKYKNEKKCSRIVLVLTLLGFYRLTAVLGVSVTFTPTTARRGHSGGCAQDAEVVSWRPRWGRTRRPTGGRRWLRGRSVARAQRQACAAPGPQSRTSLGSLGSGCHTSSTYWTASRIDQLCTCRLAELVTATASSADGEVRSLVREWM